MKIIQLEMNDTEAIKKAEEVLLENGIQCSIEELEHLAEMDRLIEEKQLEFKITQLEHQITELDDLYLQLKQRVRGFVKMDIATGKMSIVDKFLEELSGYSYNKWKKTPNFIQTIIHPDFEDYYASRMAELKKGIVPKMMQYKIIKQDGEERWWLQFNIGAFDINGQLVSISAVIIDNTEQKKVEIKYQNLFENLNAGVFRVNIETGEFLDVNLKIAEYLGYSTVKEFKEKSNAKDFYCDIEDRNKICRLLKENGKVTDYEVKLKTGNGDYVWVSHSASYYPKEGFCEGIIVNITDRKKAEKQSHESEEKFRSIVEQSVAGMIIVQNNKIVFTNDVIFKASGYDHNQINSMELEHIFEIIHPADREFVKRQFIRVEKEGIVPEFYCRIIAKDNGIIWLSTQLKKFSYEEGTAISCVMVEVTDRVQLEQKFILERNLARSYFDMAGVMLLVLDRGGKVEQINKKGCAILGYTKEEIIGKNWMENFLPRRIQTAVQRTFDKCINGEIRSEDYYENYILTKSDEERLISWHNAVLRDAEGNITAIISSGEDITTPKVAEKITGDNEIRSDSVKDSNRS